MFLVLGSVALLGVSEGDGPTYLGIPSNGDAEIPSRGGRFRLDMTVDEYKAEFRLTDQETEQLAVLVEERDSLQSQVDVRLEGIQELVGPGVHKLDAKKLSKQFGLDEGETTRLETLIEEWIRLASELRDKDRGDHGLPCWSGGNPCKMIGGYPCWKIVCPSSGSVFWRILGKGGWGTPEKRLYPFSPSEAHVVHQKRRYLDTPP
jgi:hypothetical protein